MIELTKTHLYKSAISLKHFNASRNMYFKLFSNYPRTYYLNFEFSLVRVLIEESRMPRATLDGRRINRCHDTASCFDLEPGRVIKTLMINLSFKWSLSFG